MYTYIHIPFCKSKCTYCDFFSVELNDVNGDGSRTLSNYIDALLREAAYHVKKHKILAWKSLYLGGGTPSLLTIPQIKKLFNGLLDLCPLENNAEVTFEVNPAEISDSFAMEYLNGLRDCGINRVSCGVQALDDNVLTCVNRRSSKDECIKALENLQVWRDNSKKEHLHVGRDYQFSIDCISGLPNLSTRKFLQSLKTIINYNPDHISLYSLILEETTPLYTAIEEGKLVFDEEKSDKQWLKGSDLLRDSGYIQYEVSNFSKNTQSESVHNKAYWRMENYIGLGSGACGTVEDSRFTGTKNIIDYCSYWNARDTIETVDVPKSILDIEGLTINDRAFEYLMMGFRTLEGVCAKEYYSRFGEELETKIGKVFLHWQSRGLCRISNTRYSLTEQGLLYLNSFLREIL